MLPSIQVLGVRAYHKTETLKKLVEQALKALRIDVPVQMVTGLEDMVEAGITAIPAVIIDGHVVIQGEIPTQEEVLRVMRGVLRSQKILVPVDFSEASHIALRYAEGLARKYYLNVKVLHVYNPAVNIPETMMQQSATEWLDGLHEDMRSFIDRESPLVNSRMQTPEVPTEYEIRSGRVEAELRRESRLPETRLVIMANSGDHDIGNRWFGSTAVKVARQADCPVLLVPVDYSFSGFRRITVATDQSKVAAWHKKFVDGMISPENGKVDYVNIELKKPLNAPVLSTEEVTDNSVVQHWADTVEEGLLSYASETDSDLIVLLAQHRRGWQDLFHRSCTRELARKCPLPILVVPPAPKQ
ncbi:MAG: universal stress protein [Bacteroidetes bacterium]|nr:universal stress protein [Bacteroidota bacterium]